MSGGGGCGGPGRAATESRLIGGEAPSAAIADAGVNFSIIALGLGEPVVISILDYNDRPAGHNRAHADIDFLAHAQVNPQSYNATYCVRLFSKSLLNSARGEAGERLFAERGRGLRHAAEFGSAEEATSAADSGFRIA